MDVYVIVKEDHGYLGYGPEIGSGSVLESIHESFEDAYQYLQRTYGKLYDCFVGEDSRGVIKWRYRWFDDRDEHEYELTIYKRREPA